MTRSTAFVAKLVLASLIAGARAEGKPDESGEQVRRLRESTGLPEACLSACPGLRYAMTSLQQSMAGMQQTTNVGLMTERMYGLVYTSMCANKAAYTCMGNNSACPSNSQQSGLGANPMVVAQSHMACLCDACPSLQRGYAKVQGALISFLMNAFQNMGSGASTPANETVPDDLLRSLCYMVDGMACSSSNPSQCSAMFSGGSGGMNLSSLTQDTAQLRQQCDAKGFVTSAPTTYAISSAVKKVLPISLAVLVFASFVAGWIA